MISLILQTATRYILSLMLLFAVFLLLRGHNEPGGGFIAGLVAATGFALYSLSTDVSTARRALYIDPHTLIGIGLLTAISSGTLSAVLGQPFMTGDWLLVNLPLVGEIDLGTPLFFDIGVFLVVWGVTLMIIFTLAEE
jgi:multicomponent Na+:H+ antiporter subunit B